MLSNDLRNGKTLRHNLAYRDGYGERCEEEFKIPEIFKV